MPYAMNSIRALILGTLLVVLLPTAALEREPHLCTAEERVLFSCASKDKVISICASRDLVPATGVVVYRYGSEGNKPELEYSSAPGKFEEYFNYSYSGYAKGSTQELSFTIGAYRYTVHVDKHAFRGDASGVFVERDSEQLAYKECNNPFQVSNLYELKRNGFPVGSPRHIGTPSP
jgi:hypothetical protein